jgi:hypothetical protein
VIVFNYGSRTVANHAQSRENWFLKERLQLRKKSSRAEFFSSEIWKYIFLLSPANACVPDALCVKFFLRASMKNCRPPWRRPPPVKIQLASLLGIPLIFPPDS